MTAWVHGSSEPLRARYDATARELLAHGHQPEYPVTEAAHFRNLALLDRIKPPPAQNDEALRAAGREHFNLRVRYRHAALEVIRLQGRLSSCVDDWVDRLLGDIPRGWDVNLVRELEDTDANASAADVRRAITKALPAVLPAEALQTELSQALNADNREPASLHQEMIAKLFARVEQLERATTAMANAAAQRTDGLEDTINRIGKRLRARRKT